MNFVFVLCRLFTFLFFDMSVLTNSIVFSYCVDYSFPYILLGVSVIANAIHLARFENQVSYYLRIIMVKFLIIFF